MGWKEVTSSASYVLWSPHSPAAVLAAMDIKIVARRNGPRKARANPAWVGPGAGRMSRMNAICVSVFSTVHPR